VDGSLEVGPYRTLFRIASGGMAEVHAASLHGEAGFLKLVAVKRLLAHLAEDPKLVEMFLDEARVSAMVSSPRVVQTIDAGRSHDGLPYLVMDLVVGVTLAELLADAARAGCAIPVRAAAEIIACAAEGLEDVHEAKTPAGTPLAIVHRDVSPQNILLGADGSVRVSDFGIAHAAERRTRTETGELKGKFAYYSPEQARGERLDRRSDVFALAVTAWEAFAGQRLFARGSTAVSLLDSVREQPIAHLDTVRDDLPDGLADAIARALERDKEQRTPSGRALADEIRRAMGADAADGRTIAGVVRELSARRVAAIESRLRASIAGASVPEPAAPGPWSRSKAPTVLAREPMSIGRTPAGVLEPPIRRTRSGASIAVAAVLTVATLAMVLVVPVLGAGTFLLGRPHTVSPSSAEALSVRVIEREVPVAPADAAPMQPRCEQATSETALESRHADAAAVTEAGDVTARVKPVTRRRPRTLSGLSRSGLRDPFRTRR
jgi:serine/threonine-protein kinase